MSARKLAYPSLNDWSAPLSDDSQNVEPIDKTQGHSNNEQAKEFHSLNQPVNCWTWMSPCLVGLALGVLTNGVALAAVLTLWLSPQPATTTAATGGSLPVYEVPTGTVFLYGGNLSALSSMTHRWLLCDGSAVSRTTYQDLFTVIGITYGAGNGVNTFNLPDFRARFPMGSNGGSLTMGGAASHTLTISQMPTHSHSAGTLQTVSAGQHTHDLTDPGHDHGGSTGDSAYSSGSFAMSSSTGGAGDDNGVHSHTISTGYTGISMESAGGHTHGLQGSTSVTGGSEPFNITPLYQSIHYIIRA